MAAMVAMASAMASSCSVSPWWESLGMSSRAEGHHQVGPPRRVCRHVALSKCGPGFDSRCQLQQAASYDSRGMMDRHVALERHVALAMHSGRGHFRTQIESARWSRRHVDGSSSLLSPRHAGVSIAQEKHNGMAVSVAGRSGWPGRADTWQALVPRSGRSQKSAIRPPPTRAEIRVKSTTNKNVENSIATEMEDDDDGDNDGAMAGAESKDTVNTGGSLSQASSGARIALPELKRTNLFRGSVIAGTSLLVAAGLTNLDTVAQHQGLAMGVVFSLGYAGIVFEEALGLNKSGVGLLMAVALWTIRSIAAPSPEMVVAELSEQASSVSEIIFFLLGAMTIVEVVDAHQGFKIVTDGISTKSSRVLLWTGYFRYFPILRDLLLISPGLGPKWTVPIGFISFFLSSILDNLTTTIVMVSLLRKLIPNPEQRKYCGAAVVIAANAGGAWTPIGDVTTTMLWIHGQITTTKVMQALFLPSMACLLVPLALMSFSSEVAEPRSDAQPKRVADQLAPNGQLVFAVGIGALLFVPVFKALTGLPPYLGMLCGLGALWMLTDVVHAGENEREDLTVTRALSRIDMQGVLFFLGILLSIGCLESAGLLKELAVYLSNSIPSLDLLASLIGLASAVIDNVPLVAATMGMYGLSEFPADDRLWHLIAYCAGTGGSILIIGSAAGVAYMGMEKADFFWYLKKVSFPAFAGYVAGISLYILSEHGTGYLQNVFGLLPQLPQLPFS